MGKPRTQSFKEGKMKKGGLNSKPSVPRPATPPPGQRPSKTSLMEELQLPVIKVQSGKVLTIFEVGNPSVGMSPTQEDLLKIRNLVKEATEQGSSSIFIPAGTVKVWQVVL